MNATIKSPLSQRKTIDKVYLIDYTVDVRDKESEVKTMTTIEPTNIQLTDDTLQNIKIMAPLLDETRQNQVFGLMLGFVKDIEISNGPEKEG